MNTRVLVVDDESDTLDLLRTILEISGYEPITTLNSVDALMIAQVEKPDVVLLDIMMPRLDGFTLCKLMRAHSATKHLPIIFVSAYSALDIEDRRVEAGADLVIAKPIGMDNLIETINQALKKRPPVKDLLPAQEAPPGDTKPLSIPAPDASVVSTDAPTVSVDVPVVSGDIPAESGADAPPANADAPVSQASTAETQESAAVRAAAPPTPDSQPAVELAD